MTDNDVAVIGDICRAISRIAQVTAHVFDSAGIIKKGDFARAIRASATPDEGAVTHGILIGVAEALERGEAPCLTIIEGDRK